MSKEKNHEAKKSNVLVDSKGRKEDHPNFDRASAKPVEQSFKKDAIQEMEDSVADLAKEVGGSQKQDSTVYVATARVQKALEVLKKQL